MPNSAKMTVPVISYSCENSTTFMICDLPITLGWSSGSSEISVCFVNGFHEASLSAFIARSHLPASWLHLIVKTNVRMKKRDYVRRRLGKTNSEHCFLPLVVGMWCLTSLSPFISRPRRGPPEKSASHSGSRKRLLFPFCPRFPFQSLPTFCSH